MEIKPHITTKDLLIPICFDNTQASHNEDAYIGNERNSLSVTIQFPGFGINLATPGVIDIRMYGNEIPNPNDVKINRVVIACCEIAKVRAGAINGAVHGLATNVTNIPLKNSDKYRDFALCCTLRDEMSYNPERFNPMRYMMYIEIEMNTGFCIWNPHPTLLPM